MFNPSVLGEGEYDVLWEKVTKLLYTFLFYDNGVHAASYFLAFQQIKRCNVFGELK